MRKTAELLWDFCSPTRHHLAVHPSATRLSSRGCEVMPTSGCASLRLPAHERVLNPLQLAGFMSLISHATPYTTLAVQYSLLASQLVILRDDGRICPQKSHNACMRGLQSRHQFRASSASSLLARGDSSSHVRAPGG